MFISHLLAQIQPLSHLPVVVWPEAPYTSHCPYTSLCVGRGVVSF